MPRYYIKDSILSFEEDETHEFKGHRTISVEDLAPIHLGDAYNFRSRRPVSRSICAFLNTGKGGTLYVGVSDEGSVRGIRLTRYQKDHVLLAVDDMMSRYTPPVLKHQISVTFVNVVEQEDESMCDDSTDSELGSLDDNLIHRLRSHTLRSHRYCWCDYDGMATLNSGVLTTECVIEIEIAAWDKNDVKNKIIRTKTLDLHPIYENEEHKAFIRKQASVSEYSRRKICDDAVEEVRAHYNDEIEKLYSRLAVVKKLAQRNL